MATPFGAATRGWNLVSFEATSKAKKRRPIGIVRRCRSSVTYGGAFYLALFFPQFFLFSYNTLFAFNCSFITV